MDYKNFNDYELVYQVRENDSIAYDILLKKYSKLVNKYARMYYIKNKALGIEMDDLYQEGMMGVIMALNDYNSEDTLFYTYALLCIRREMERLVKTCSRKKQMVLNNSISFSNTVHNEDDLFLEDIVASDFNMEKNFYSDELSKYLINLKYELSDDDSLIYELRLNSFNNKEIAALLDMPYKVVDNRLRKIRKFIKQHISSFA